MSVATQFELFCSNIRISDENVAKIRTRYKAITRRINQDYWGIDSDTSHSLYVGSYGRDTEIHLSDIDILIELPSEIYKKYNASTYNGQSALLQSVRRSLIKTYSSSALSADGQVIAIPFSNGITFEIVPGFINSDKVSYTYGDTNAGGRWKVTNPKLEIKAISDGNKNWNYNLKRLCRMLRAWKDKNSVGISGLLIDTLAYNFMSTWEFSSESYLYYDWMTRDCFEFMSQQNIQQKYWLAPGSNQQVYKKGYFVNKAKAAYLLAVKAIDYSDNDKERAANVTWRQIYGSKFPLRMS